MHCGKTFTPPLDQTYRCLFAVKPESVQFINDILHIELLKKLSNFLALFRVAEGV